MQDPGTSPEGRNNRPLVIGLVLVGAVILAVAIGMSMHGSASNGAAPAPEQQTANVTPPAQEQQNRDAEEKGQEAHRLQMEAENLQMETEKRLCEPVSPTAYRRLCVTVTILQAHMVNITHTDENGYEHILRSDVQRLTVAMELPKTGQGLFRLFGQLFNGDVATADILCLQRCPELDVGTRHIMGTAATPSLEGSFLSPYLYIGNVKWQILELCHDTIQDRCTEMSTPHTEP